MRKALGTAVRLDPSHQVVETPDQPGVHDQQADHGCRPVTKQGAQVDAGAEAQPAPIDQQVDDPEKGIDHHHGKLVAAPRGIRDPACGQRGQGQVQAQEEAGDGRGIGAALHPRGADQREHDTADDQRPLGAVAQPDQQQRHAHDQDDGKEEAGHQGAGRGPRRQRAGHGMQREQPAGQVARDQGANQLAGGDGAAGDEGGAQRHRQPDAAQQVLPDGSQRAVDDGRAVQRRQQHLVEEATTAVAHQAVAGEDHRQPGQHDPGDDQERGGTVVVANRPGLGDRQQQQEEDGEAPAGPLNPADVALAIVDPRPPRPLPERIGIADFEASADLAEAGEGAAKRQLQGPRILAKAADGPVDQEHRPGRGQNERQREGPVAHHPFEFLQHARFHGRQVGEDRIDHQHGPAQVDIIPATHQGAQDQARGQRHAE